MIFTEAQEYAKKLMAKMQLEAGSINSIEGSEPTYPGYHLNRIGEALRYFLESNPYLIEKFDQLIEDLLGDEDEMNDRYGNLNGFSKLARVLNKYHESI